MPSASTDMAIPNSTGGAGAALRSSHHPAGMARTKDAGVAQPCAEWIQTLQQSGVPAVRLSEQRRRRYGESDQASRQNGMDQRHVFQLPRSASSSASLSSKSETSLIRPSLKVKRTILVQSRRLPFRLAVSVAISATRSVLDIQSTMPVIE